MFGFVLGAVCLFGLGAMARRRRYWRGYGYGYGCGPARGHHYAGGPWGGYDGPAFHGPEAGPGHHGHHGHYGHHGYGPGPRFRGRFWRGGLAMMMRRLQLTPDQQTVVREEVSQLMQTMQTHREEWAASRRDVAQAMRNESFDATVMGELFGRHDERLTEVRKAVMEALGRIHAVLDETQRERLAQILDQGPGHWHPFRSDAV